MASMLELKASTKLVGKFQAESFHGRNTESNPLESANEIAACDL